MNRRTFLASVVLAPSLSSMLSAQCVWGTPQWHPQPVLEPTWEGRCAMPYSDGCWWDEARQVFRLWYMAGYRGATALAESKDGYEFVKRGIVDQTPRDSSTVWPYGPREWVRATYFLPDDNRTFLTIQHSFDGFKWTTVSKTPSVGERSTIYPVGDRWVLSARSQESAVRQRHYYVADDLFGSWERIASNFTEADADDGDGAQLYNLDAVAVGSGYLGLATIWHGDEPDEAGPKRNTISAVTSQDGLTWQRGPRQWIIGEPGTWHAGNLQSCGGCLVKLSPSRLGLYVSARSGPVASQRCVTGLLTIDRKGVCL